MKLTAEQRERTIASLERRAIRSGLRWLLASVARMRRLPWGDASWANLPPAPNCRCVVSPELYAEMAAAR